MSQNFYVLSSSNGTPHFVSVKAPKDIKMKKIQYLICFFSLCEETQPISAVVGISYLQVSDCSGEMGVGSQGLLAKGVALNCVGEVVQLWAMLHILNETFHP